MLECEQRLRMTWIAWVLVYLLTINPVSFPEIKNARRHYWELRRFLTQATTTQNVEGVGNENGEGILFENSLSQNRRSAHFCSLIIMEYVSQWKESCSNPNIVDRVMPSDSKNKLKYLFQIVNPLITSLIYAPYRMTIKRFLVNIPVGNRPLYQYGGASERLD